MVDAGLHADDQVKLTAYTKSCDLTRLKRHSTLRPCSDSANRSITRIGAPMSTAIAFDLPRCEFRVHLFLGADDVDAEIGFDTENKACWAGEPLFSMRETASPV